MAYWKPIFAVLVATGTLAGPPKITCEPAELSGVPGEPLRLELAVETDHAIPMQLRIPAVSNLVLRTVEKIPIHRMPDGRFIQKRIVIWQGVEAGSVTLSNLMIQAGSETQLLPAIEITINKVVPTTPPAMEEE